MQAEKGWCVFFSGYLLGATVMNKVVMEAKYIINKFYYAFDQLFSYMGFREDG